MKSIRFSNLAAMMSIMVAGIERQYKHLSPSEIDGRMRSAQRSLAKRHARFYGTGKKVIHETANCQAAQRRRRHIEQGRYPQAQLLRAA